MTVKLLSLKPNQDVIADIEEIRTQPNPDVEGDQGRVVGYQLSHPYVITLSKVMDEENPEYNSISVNISRWNPYSIDTKYQVPGDIVNVICEPIPKLVQTWKSKVETEENLIKQMTEPTTNTVVQQELLNEERTDSDTEE